MAGNADQITEWNGPLGDKWVELQAQFDAVTKPFGEAALKAAAAQSCETVLDIGCGCGGTSLKLAAAVGPSGSVLGVDISRPMLEAARRRTAGSGNVEFREADASVAVLPQDRDLLFSRFGVMFFDEPVAAFTHLHGALKPTGRLAFCCWRAPKENPWAAVPTAAVREALNVTEPPPHPHSPGPFALADPDRLRGILSDAGFKAIGITPFDAPVRLGGNPREAAEDAARLGPSGRLVRLAGEDALPRALAALEAALAPLAGPDGLIAPTGAVWIVTASA